MHQFCTSLDTITINQPIVDGDVIVSTGQTFALGFFSPGKSSYRYLGIWYNKISEKTVVWVANRDSPINDTSGVLSITSHGNLALHSRNQTTPLWFTNASALPTNNCVAQLLDSGNLVLFRSGSAIWQSFEHPTNNLLPNSKLGLDRRKGLNWFLTSWKSSDDPGTSNFSYRFNPEGYPQLFLYEGHVPKWRAGYWNGVRWSGVPAMQRYSFIFNYTIVNNENEISVSWNDVYGSVLTRIVVNESGLFQRLKWHEDEGQWKEFFYAPKEQCDSYGLCGAYGNCVRYNGEFDCTCLPGYQPKSPQEWHRKGGSGGCVRKNQTPLCRNGEGFVEVTNVKAPDTSVARVLANLDMKACKNECLRNCSCTAYASLGTTEGSGCLTWYGDLLDTRVFTEGGQSIYVRVDALELAQYANKRKDLLARKGILVIMILSVATAVSSLVLFSYCLVRRQRRLSQNGQHEMCICSSSTLPDDHPREKELDRSGSDPHLPFFDIDTIVEATDNFSNKLGEGGFGSVYKCDICIYEISLEMYFQGQLSNGQEIAVKRLSKQSGQGIKEFMNEVQLISKLQHRNLVRLFGCCIHKEDKMLIYEYLPNKSLDYFIFEKSRKQLLDWKKHFEIIFGVARAVLYLHQDSRLKIIHRDLKASNILLDASMEPKISDFGLAKLFKEHQIEAITKQVVGTYGYMSPEYAMDGLYSVKSDVFSYGVLILEIISGKKNTEYDKESPSLNLIGNVWKLWREGKGLDIVDYSLLEHSYPCEEILRCIQIGLLCIQEHPADRPTMLEVVFMLGNETSLPSPKKPAFVFRTQSGQESLITRGEVCSINDCTITMIEGR
ncbi:hypothetical protein GH714_019508 [Hevea brasiliensis]|uniref:Receptor-like serine/threonine-protein kinase n=1 Tax=Hevea brasiliensis TaxID=3981 RepID=A0A6A6LU69_HEVBR|nr:hypothetical protein GH714_019508 [Hevea brasiliensis]